MNKNKIKFMSVVNELHQDNPKPHKLKIDTIFSICSDKKLQEAMRLSLK